MGFLAYLIIRYKAFDIKILGSQVLVISIIALIGSQFFFVENITNVVLIMATLISSAVFGLWLVGSVKKEVKSKETLEKNVLDRTKELEQSKKISEERAAELEKWYKLTIGRELKMAELKKQVEELEDKK